ncbi:hypothetical protein LHJ74_07850 [Streptomyces sp. N2-109]|uniref:Uncharacterized protein n=1 Tax=Streptomyces gossypii TaxID=2883101 RepID=A0ABT2JPM8_9ACTN|nr:hypothetical protein [Streptomyces gossypii]MCT2589827.1 hypothetical protein [Streptomyces gossypii]
MADSSPSSPTKAWSRPPTILRTHRATPDLVISLARHPDQVDAAIDLLPRLDDTDIEGVVTGWDLNRHRRGAEPTPPLPPALFDAVLDHALTPLVLLLQNPHQHEEWKICERPDWGLPHEFGRNAAWRVLRSCPDRWRTLVEHPVLGTAVQHLLLDQAEVEHGLTREAEDDLPANREAESALNVDLLRACLPALSLPEMADLPKPSATARHRLHSIAERVRSNPRLSDIAAEELHTVADACVRRGRLLTPPRNAKDRRRQHAVTLAKDLALLSANPTHLTKACACSPPWNSPLSSPARPALAWPISPAAPT